MVGLGRLTLILVVFAASDSIACTPPSGINPRIATNVELVQEADLIILGRVVSGPPPTAKIGLPWADPPQIVVQPTEILKGVAPRVPPRLFGSLYNGNGKSVQPAPTTLTEANPNVYEGGCIRTQFSKGTLVVAMFKKTQAGLRSLHFAFARNAEDVADPNATWVRAVKYYVTASAPGPQDQRTAFIALRTKLIQRGDPDDLEIAKDIGTYLHLNIGTKHAATKPWATPD